MFFTFSCRKEEVIVDREDSLSDDTALFVYNAFYVSHTPTNLNFTMDVLILKGTETELDYSDHSFYDTSYVQDQNLSFGSASNYNFPNTSGYNTVILFDYSETESYRENFAGFYLRRFFEIADSLPNRNVALSSMSSEHNTPTRFHSQTPGDIFGNSWEYNVNTFYQYTAYEDYSSNGTNGLYFKNHVIGVIDTIMASGVTGDLSVTILVGNGGVMFSDLNDVDEIIDHALMNNVKINIISPGSAWELHYLAHATGGFVSSYLSDYTYNNMPEQGFSNIQITLQNLDELLTGNVTTHRVTGTASQTGSSTWASGQTAYLTVRYDNFAFDLGIRIP